MVGRPTHEPWCALPRVGPMWHTPIISHTRQSGTHPTTRGGGYGDSVHTIRPYEPGDDPNAISPIHTAMADGVEHVVIFRRFAMTKVVLLADLSPAIDVGTPRKRDALLGIVATLGRLTIGPPNDGTLDLHAGGRAYSMITRLGLQMAMHALTDMSPRPKGDGGIAPVLERIAYDEYETLIVIVSDFLINADQPAGVQELARLIDAARLARSHDNEVMTIRLLAPEEATFPKLGGSLTVAGRDQGVWTGKSTAAALARRHSVVRQMLHAVTDDADNDIASSIRRLELVWDTNVEHAKRALHAFLLRRCDVVARMLRTS